MADTPVSFDVLFGWIGGHEVHWLEREISCAPAELDAALMELLGKTEEGTGRRLYIRSIQRRLNGASYSSVNGVQTNGVSSKT